MSGVDAGLAGRSAALFIDEFCINGEAEEGDELNAEAPVEENIDVANGEAFCPKFCP